MRTVVITPPPQRSVLIRGVMNILICLLWRLNLWSSHGNSHHIWLYQGIPALLGQRLNVVSRWRRGVGRDKYINAVGSGRLLPENTRLSCICEYRRFAENRYVSIRSNSKHEQCMYKILELLLSGYFRRCRIDRGIHTVYRCLSETQSRHNLFSCVAIWISARLCHGLIPL